MNKATISHLAKHLKPTSQVLMRADFNVPIKEGKIKDDNRIKSKHHITKVPSQQLKTFFHIVLNLWFYSLIWEDQMGKIILNNHWRLLFLVLRNNLEDQSPSSMIVLEIALLKRLMILMEKFSFVRTYDSILKKKDPLRIRTERKLKYHKKRFQHSEGNFLN